MLKYAPIKPYSNLALSHEIQKIGCSLVICQAPAPLFRLRVYVICQETFVLSIVIYPLLMTIDVERSPSFEGMTNDQ